VSEVLTKKIKAKLSFTGVDFGIFPPSTIFKNVHIEKLDPVLADIDMQVEELNVSFTYASFFSSNLEIDDLTLKNGKIAVVTHNQSSPEINWKELSVRKLFNQYSDLLMKSPIKLNIARLENTEIKIDSSKVFIESMSVAPHKKDVRFKVKSKNIHIEHNNPEFPAFDLSTISALVEITRDEWMVQSLKVEKDLNKIELKAKLFNQQNVINASVSGSFVLDIKSLLGLYPKHPEALEGTTGLARGEVETSGSLFDPEAQVSVNVDQFKSKWIELEKIKAILKKNKNILTLEKFLAENLNERYELQKRQPLFDLKKQNLIHVKAPISLRDSFTNTFLFSLNDKLEVLKGYITGVVDVIWDGEKVFFEIKDKAIVKDFKLLAKSTRKPILQNNGFSLEQTVFDLDKNLTLGLTAKITMPNSNIKADGEINSKGINISIKDSKIDMKHFGPIAGIDITGAGPASAEIYGPFENVKFDFIVDWNNFSLVELNFGKVKSEFTFALNDLKIDIHKLEGQYNQSSFVAGGSLEFGDKSGMDIGIDFKNTTFSDAKKMYHLIFKNIKLPSEPELNFSTSYRIKGGYSVESLNIEGILKGSELKVFNEEAERLTMKFSLQNNLLSFNDIKIFKSRGELNSDVSISLVNNYTELDGSLKGLRLSDFNFYKKLKLEYDGDLSVDFDGNGTKENFSSRFKTRVLNPFIENIPASPSNAIIYLNSDEVVVNANLLSGKIRLDSLINFSTRMASLKTKIETTDIREILGAVAGHNMAEKNISGEIKTQLNTQFNVDTFSIKKLFLDIEKFNVKKGDINIQVDDKHNSIALDDGAVKNWDIKFIDGEDFFISRAKNISESAISFEQNFSIKTSILELISNSVEKTVGVMKGANQFVIDKKVYITKFTLGGTKNSIKIKNIPGAITDLDYLIVKKGNYFEILKFTGKYGEGDVKISGTFLFDDLYPQTNIDYKIERATIPLFKRSNLLASSSGTITGTELPYKLNGKVSLLHGEFLDDPSDFTKEGKVSIDNLKKYLPQKDDAEKKGYLDLNVAFDTVNQITIKNKLAEVYVKGSGQLIGNVLNPEITAKIEAIPGVSKFKFKGHDFILSQGNVDVRDRGKIRVSELKFIGLAKINDYDVTLDISGSIPKPVITLASEPSLAQEDLLSLLTLGVTSDMSKNLEASERSSVTTVSIGALLVDQLKINEDLNSTLGLKLSVLPEFREDETSLISGKSAVSDSSSSRLKSGTKIKVSKQINKKMDASVSSTVGGSIEQTQEMNVNYNFNKKFSIQGVYEVKPTEEENTSTPNSIGADIKYRWSF
jgi:translocation and assembly module TamB